MVASTSGFREEAFIANQEVTQYEPLALTILNVGLNMVVHHLTTLVYYQWAVHQGLGVDISKKGVVFYTYNSWLS